MASPSIREWPGVVSVLITGFLVEKFDSLTERVQFVYHIHSEMHSEIPTTGDIRQIIRRNHLKPIL